MANTDPVVAEIRSTKDYSRFQLITANRDKFRQHVNNFKTALSENNLLFKGQPILVNESWFIVDGQHRFTAASELGLEVYYTQIPGIGIKEARAINILQKPWGPIDFAKSYALGGNKNYQEYMRARSDYELSHSIVLNYLSNRKEHGAHARFRRGEWEVEDVTLARKWMDDLLEIKEKSPMSVTNPFAMALLQVFAHPNFNYERFVAKLEKHGSQYLYKSTLVEDHLRMIEQIYNHGLQNTQRLF